MPEAGWLRALVLQIFRRPELQAPRFLLFIDLVQVGKALEHDINRMVLSVACRKAFVGENVVVHRNDGAAAAAKDGLQSVTIAADSRSQYMTPARL